MLMFGDEGSGESDLEGQSYGDLLRVRLGGVYLEC